MSDFKYVLLLLVVLAGAAVASKPEPRLFEDTLRSSISVALDGARRDYLTDTKLAAAIGKLKCSISADGCVPRIKRDLTLRRHDLILFRAYVIQFDGQDVIRCFGTANSIYCMN